MFVRVFKNDGSYDLVEESKVLPGMKVEYIKPYKQEKEKSKKIYNPYKPSFKKFWKSDELRFGINRKRRRELEFFWDKFDGEDEDGKIYLLRVLSSYVFKKRSFQSIANRRKRFLKIRSRKILLKYDCSVCGSSPVIRHHIISIKNGGDNSFINLIPICEGCHEKIHPWLGLEKLAN